ncbi:serine protease [Kribbella antibiotica]|uniref:Serine protease n=1 Tax=Kribbella antibiotica TaxID=190195 RepID=A0A4R4ZRY2_9ACTN|nr:serine protease [Kribbella antibiotica]TDD60689.1 serine protease [Kribbella antibiotica]
MSWDEAELIEIIKTHPAVADEALAAIQQDVANPLNLASIGAVAAFLGKDAAEQCIIQLRGLELLDAFGEALRARGVEIDGTAAGAGRINIEGMHHFLERAKSFRCRIEVDNRFAGSGCLVGPGLVLTTWHVVRREGPGIVESPPPQVTVVLSDKSTHEAAIPPSFESPCGADEWKSIAPRQDADVLNRHDVALLTLRKPAARHLGFVRMPPTAPPATSRMKLYLLDFPAGVDEGLGDGTTWKIRGVSVRLRHDVKTAGGSSGGACFNDRFEFFGLHQGKTDKGKYGRFVPAYLFLDAVAGLIQKDISPTELWHLDGRSDRLVIGRDLFVRSVAEASKSSTRVRGIRVKRTDDDETGLGFSYRILDELLLRQGGAQFAVRVPVGDAVPDLMLDITQRVEASGLAVIEPPSPGGVDPVQAAPEAAARDRAARLALAVNEAASKLGRTVWFFFDGPSGRMSDPVRLHLEGFIAACLTLPQVRVVVAGLETVRLGGLEFATPDVAGGDGPAGLVVDYLGGFTRADLKDCLTRAATELTEAADPVVINSQADIALQGFVPFNERYAAKDLGTVVDRLQPYLTLLRALGETP